MGVSVIMPVFNAERFVEEAIASVLGQTRADCELLVIDDGSTDGSAALVGRIADPRLRLERTEANRGAAAARNRGLELARGEWVAAADADDLWLPHRLELQLALVDSQPDLDVVAGGREVMSEDGRALRSVVPLVSNDALRLGLRWGPSFGHGSLLVRREALSAVGGYDPSKEPAEDYDLYRRLAQAGRRFGAVPEVVYRYRLNSAGVSRRQRARQRRSHEETSEALRRSPAPGDLRRWIAEGRRQPRLAGGDPRLRYQKLLIRVAREELRAGRPQRGLAALLAAVAVDPSCLLIGARNQIW